LWFAICRLCGIEIEGGKLDHIRALIEQYLAVVDNVLPAVAIQRITCKRLITLQPGLLHYPTFD
jgi:hypothetical protein